MFVNLSHSFLPPVNLVTFYKSNVKQFPAENRTFTSLQLTSCKRRNKKLKANTMNNIFKGLIAGYGANKLGGGCFGTIIIFVIIWWLLGLF
jgi:hypothetical protein